MILDIFPNLDVYPIETNWNYLGFGKRPLKNARTSKLLFVCPLKNTQAKFYLNQKSDPQFFQIVSDKYFGQIQFDLVQDISLIKQWLLFIKEQIASSLDTYIGSGYFPIDYKNKNNSKHLLENEIGIIDSKKYSLNQILYGLPGTGKTYNTINKALEIIGIEIPDSVKDDEKAKRVFLKNEFRKCVDTGQIVFTTFHQSMCYEDFIEGIKPKLDDDNPDEPLKYCLEDGFF